MIAGLHADSWRRHYRGAYSDAFLDGDVVSDRRAVWRSRFGDRAGTATIVAEQDGVDGVSGVRGFVHVVFDDDPRWGSLVDNLHVADGHRHRGVGTLLLRAAADAVRARAAAERLYLWVLEQNTAAQRFYRARGGVQVESVPVAAAGGVPGRLSGAPVKLRMVWATAQIS
ncbi:GNAT family N-acetyltransferase [Dactylosporangium sp. NPDC005555]|uniref:GNAT family N-acetyltransferase n=1 Tax=Dactylosporangium sp. NPDC005555 TaxID=3154889 RepID=UPI0033B07D43